MVVCVLSLSLQLHMLGEEGRGAILEACLVKIRFSSPHTHIIGMSATLSNPHHLASFLDAAVFTDSFRPVSAVTRPDTRTTRLLVSTVETR